MKPFRNISFPDGITLESALAQLRHSMISCSFIQIGSPPHPDFSFGYVPYIDFMKFISVATFGSYLAISPDYVCVCFQLYKQCLSLNHFKLIEFWTKFVQCFSPSLFCMEFPLWTLKYCKRLENRKFRFKNLVHWVI